MGPIEWLRNEWDEVDYDSPGWRVFRLVFMVAFLVTLACCALVALSVLVVAFSFSISAVLGWVVLVLIFSGAVAILSAIVANL